MLASEAKNLIDEAKGLHGRLYEALRALVGQLSAATEEIAEVRQAKTFFQEDAAGKHLELSKLRVELAEARGQKSRAEDLQASAEFRARNYAKHLEREREEYARTRRALQLEQSRTFVLRGENEKLDRIAQYGNHTCSDCPAPDQAKSCERGRDSWRKVAHQYQQTIEHQRKELDASRQTLSAQRETIAKARAMLKRAGIEVASLRQSLFEAGGRRRLYLAAISKLRQAANQTADLAALPTLWGAWPKIAEVASAARLALSSSDGLVPGSEG